MVTLMSWWPLSLCVEGHRASAGRTRAQEVGEAEKHSEAQP